MEAAGMSRYANRNPLKMKRAKTTLGLPDLETAFDHKNGPRPSVATLASTRLTIKPEERRQDVRRLKPGTPTQFA
jgi:hypothetical protein